MERPNNSMELFRYDLPDNRIAKYPLANRDESKLLVYRDGGISESKFSSIASQLPQHDLMVVNDTKVIQARMIFFKESGARIEIMLLEPVDPVEYQVSLSKSSSCVWLCLIGNKRKWKNEILSITQCKGNKQITVNAQIINSSDSQTSIKFLWQPEDWSFGQILEHFGKVPIPPYLNRQSEEIDKNRYQTVYARFEGSVAAPTAGLHITGEVLQNLQQSSIEIEKLTLHVGFGTFIPVKSAHIINHDMHAEKVIVGRSLLESLIKRSLRGVTAVGTTSLRSLESLYWLGHMLCNQPHISPDELKVTQWYPYDYDPDLSAEEAIIHLIKYLDSHRQDSLEFHTQILIAPGYTFKYVERLITNFHQPSSTLLLLVAACIGDDWQKVYDYALDNNFRFLSYGDSSLLHLNKHQNQNG